MLLDHSVHSYQLKKQHVSWFHWKSSCVARERFQTQSSRTFLARDFKELAYEADETVFNPFTPESIKSEITKLGKNETVSQFNGFPINGRTLGFCP